MSSRSSCYSSRTFACRLPRRTLKPESHSMGKAGEGIGWAVDQGGVKSPSLLSPSKCIHGHGPCQLLSVGALERGWQHLTDSIRFISNWMSNRIIYESWIWIVGGLPGCPTSDRFWVWQFGMSFVCVSLLGLPILHLGFQDVGPPLQNHYFFIQVSLSLPLPQPNKQEVPNRTKLLLHL